MCMFCVCVDIYVRFIYSYVLYDIIMETKEEEEEKKKIRHFKERFFKCKRCGGFNALYSTIREEMTCRQCGRKWIVTQEEMDGEV